MILLLNDNNQSFALPPGLKASCISAYFWTDTFAEKAIKGYLQFMKLKELQEDWHASVLSPSLVVDEVWHQHLLYNLHYNQACVDYAGQVIGHNPNGGTDKAAWKERVRATQLSLKVLAGRNIDKAVWNFPEEQENRNIVVPTVEEEGAAIVTGGQPKKKRRLAEETVDGDMAQKYGTVCVRISCEVWDPAEHVIFHVARNTKMENLFSAFVAALQKEPVFQSLQVVDLRFIFNGQRIEDDSTPNTLGLEDQDQILVMFGQSGC